MSGGFIIRIIEGRDLYAHDSDGTSDPYVNIRVGSKKIDKTKIIPNTLTPIFNESFAVPMSRVSEDSEINLLMWDDDAFGKDFMGQLSFKVAYLMKHEVSGWQTLRKRKDKDKVSGELKVSIKYFGDSLDDELKKSEAETEAKAEPEEDSSKKLEKKTSSKHVSPKTSSKDKKPKPKKQPSKSKLKSGSKTSETEELRQLLNKVTQEHSDAFTRAQENEDKLKKRDETVAKLQKELDNLRAENAELSKQEKPKEVKAAPAAPVDTSEIDELKEDVEAMQEALERNTAALEEQSSVLHAKDEELKRITTENAVTQLLLKNNQVSFMQRRGVEAMQEALERNTAALEEQSSVLHAKDEELKRITTENAEKEQTISELQASLKKAKAQSKSQAPVEAPVAGGQDSIATELSTLFDADFKQYCGADSSLSAIEKAAKVKEYLVSALAEAKNAVSDTSSPTPAPIQSAPESTSAPAGAVSYGISFISFVAAFTITSVGVAASGLVDPTNTLVSSLVIGVPAAIAGFGMLVAQGLHLGYTAKAKQA
eukprot:CAMPEP_0168522708 /NCGR_PEP_ID=MMETSP0405-20121227/9504_1 /TAXON_ID=498012 /ORGANISM="Trichosphaerium sp, Strain Am-I-7 wt" /LENGTH=539 /DNA_ID=CAMNT_0008544353 /DNA_START=111 /DNA_END=1731 /DNA_ORIENTATION=+